MLKGMPTYEYVCDKCGHSFEQFQPISADPLNVCPKTLCPQKKWGRGKVRRAISGGAGLIFKGSGFYITDYRSDSYKEAAKKDTATTVPAASRKSAEAKPASSPAGTATSAPSSTPPKKAD